MQVNFSISPRILSHLGEDLIKNESIALFELIKNSYDACAKHCIVDFHFKDLNLSRITIEDDGFGMSREVIEQVWLVVGTDNKKKNLTLNECGRIPLGEKGIGRLGVHKLGDRITLVTKTKNTLEVELRIDWTKLYSAKTITDFPIELIENPTPKTFSNGTTGVKLLIEELKTNWDRRQLREVHRNITSLNSPFSDGNDSFKVVASSNNNVFEGLPDFEDIKSSALYFGHCKMRGTEIVEFTYEFKPWESLDKVDQGRIVTLKDFIEADKTIKTLGDKRDEFIPINLDKSKIGEVEFDIIIFDTDAQIFSFVNTEKTALKKYLSENGGIRVYRDGVRVYNYGERDNDWLGIDLRRVQRVGGNVSNNIIIGSVRLKRSESFGLVEKTNREGFIEDESYFNFVQAIDYALNLIVRERNQDKAVLSTLYKKHRAVEPVLSDLNEVMHIVENKIKEPEVKQEVLKYLGRINEQYREVKEVLIKSANAGLNLGIVIHEIEKLISELTDSIGKNDQEKSTRLSLSLEKIIRGYSAMLKKSDIKFNRLSKIVEIVLDNLSYRFIDHEISIISNWKDNGLEAYFAESESISVLTNIVDNAIFWLKYARKEGRFISIYLTEEISGFVSIIISDNGPGFGLPFEVAIQPFQTKKPSNIGSGLGLHVANEMMNAMKGKLMLITDEYDINFPNAVRENKVNKAIIALCFPKEKK
jgi:signal transduction histidine kinase